MTPPATCSIGLIGLAVMGRNLALNIARKGFPIAVFNRTTSKVTSFLSEDVRDDDPVQGALTLEEFTGMLERPRRIIIMVQAGDPVDATITQLLPLLDPGDIIIDAGNSHPDDTTRRAKDLPEQGMRFIGMGVSGGEEGALLGPSIMPGGPKDAYEEIAPVLEKIAAQVEDGPCVTYLGTDAAGHFVKMVHNGIEYGDMQLIAETYDLMSIGMGMKPDELCATFTEWNKGPLESYLIEITGEIFSKLDPETNGALVDVILDRAGQKGTGRWTAEIALGLGVPLPTIHAAVDARGMSSRKHERIQAAQILSGPPPLQKADPSLVSDLHDALYAAKICSYAQGFDLLRTADRECGWNLDLGEIARIWKGGCIIRARFLDRIREAWEKNPELPSLLLDEEFGGFLVGAQAAWRRVVARAAATGVPILAMGASLSYFDSYRRERLPQNLTQAQRDFFGAHTYERVDRPEGEFFHTEW